jgi:hypothetical protein
MLKREQRRVRAAIGAALVAVGVAPAFASCSAGERVSTSDASADDATTGADDGTPVPEDATSGADAAPEAAHPFDGTCTSNIWQYDARPPPESGVDADYCGLFNRCGFPPGMAAVGCTIMFLYPDGAPASPIGCRAADDAGCYDDVYVPLESGAIDLVCSCEALGGGGRRPRGLLPRAPTRARSRVGGYLASLAHEEEASVDAFTELGSALRRHGAPSDLVVAATRSARDEVRHAKVMSRLARRLGAEPPRPRRRSGSRRVRDLASVACENAAEGCVRETYGALLASWQARHARVPTLRRAFEGIARDESRHAALSWTVAAWAEPRLDARSRRRVRRARRDAVTRLRAELGTAPDAAVACVLGLPTRREALALLDELVGRLMLGKDLR